MPKSRFTLSEIGIIAQRSKTNLKNYIKIFPLNPDSATIPKLIMIINTKSNLESLLISRSSFPIFVFGSFAFIFALVSFPVKITIARQYPAEARTVFDHIVFSRERDSL